MNEPAFTLQLSARQVIHFAARLRDKGFPPEALAGATLPEQYGVVIRFQTVAAIGGATAFFYIDKKPKAYPSLVVCLEIDELIGA